MSATDPYETQEFNRAMHEKIIACGAVPVTNDLLSTRACNVLFRQLLGLLCCDCDGVGGALYYSLSIAAGAEGTASIYAFGPVPEGPAAFGANAFDTLVPALPDPLVIAAAFALSSANPLTATFDIPAAALTANGGWIDSITLVALAGSTWGILIATSALGTPHPTVVPFTILSGADVIHVGVLLINPTVEEGGGEA